MTAAAAAAAAPTVSSVLAQVQQEATANLTLVNTVFNNAKMQPGSNIPAGFEAQVLGGQILFQQDINAVLNSLPASVSAANESNAALIATLQNLLTVEQNLSRTLSEIDTNDNLEQSIALTGLNVALILADAVILTDTSLAFAAYAAFALEGLVGQLVTVSAPGPYTVPIPAGAKYMDVVLYGGAGAGAGYNNPGSGTGGAGEATTATPTGGSTLTAAGAVSSTSATATAGGSPGNVSFDGQTYNGGIGGAAGVNGVGGNGTAPGGAGGGGAAFGSIGGAGGSASASVAVTLAITSGMTEITGSVGAGGAAGPGTTIFNTGGTGANGSAFFYFYS